MQPESINRIRKRPFSQMEQSEKELRTITFERFQGLHPDVQHPKTVFESFLEKAEEMALVNKYLDDLEDLLKKSPARTITESGWSLLIDRAVKIEMLLCRIPDNPSLQDQAIRLAFLFNHPEHSTKNKFSLDQMREALKRNDKDADEYLASLSSIRTDSKISDAKLTDVRLDIIKKGYEAPFLRSELIVCPILEKLKQQADNWDEKIYHSPYTSLIGPTTIGKTRLLTELAKHVCVVYICLRPKDSTGQPPRSALASEMTPTDQVDLTKYYDTILLAIMDVVANFFRNSSGTKEKRLKDWSNFNFPKNLETEESTNFSEVVREKMKIYDSLIPNDPKARSSELHNKVGADMFSQTAFMDSSLTVLLAIDEARSLLSTPNQLPNGLSFFRHFRCALQRIPIGKGFFTILADTTSQVANFNAAAKYDPSARDGIHSANRLFDPIYQISSLDALVSPNPPNSWRELVSATRLINYGSPVFGTYFRDAITTGLAPSKAFNGIISLALHKLLCSSKVPLPVKLTKLQALALLGPTIQPRLNGTLHANSELISSHAAHCDFISPDRDLIICNYPSQYTLASAANKALTDEGILVRCIKELTTILSLGLDAKGTAGELASRFILLSAMRRAMKLSKQDPVEITYGCSVRLADFLQALTGKQADELQLGQDLTPEHRQDLMENGMVFWNHFTQIFYTPNSNELLHFLYRGLAVQCKPLQRGFDQLFTIYLNRGPDSLDERNITFCGVQVKNAEKISILADNSKWTDEASGVQIAQDNPYLVLLISLKSPGQMAPLPRLVETKDNRQAAPLRSLETQDNRRASQVFYGLKSFPCLTNKVTEALQEMIDVEPNLPLLHDDEDGKAYVNIINPLVYTRLQR